MLVSSRDRVLPGEDADAAEVLEDVFRRRGMKVLSRSRAESASGSATASSSRSPTAGRRGLALPDGGRLDPEHRGHRAGGGRRRAQRPGTSDRQGLAHPAPGVYAAGDCTGVLTLASVAAMQGRIAMWHALGDAVTPLDLRTVSSNVFTGPRSPPSACPRRTWTAGKSTPGSSSCRWRNARAKMQGVRDGFVKLFACPGTGIVVGGVVVAPRA